MLRFKKAAFPERAKVIELDPVGRCGKLTTVVQLFGVEARDGDRFEPNWSSATGMASTAITGRECLAVKCVMDNAKLIPANALQLAM